MTKQPIELNSEASQRKVAVGVTVAILVTLVVGALAGYAVYTRQSNGNGNPSGVACQYGGTSPHCNPSPTCQYGGTYPYCNPSPNPTGGTGGTCQYGGTYPNCNPAPQNPILIIAYKTFWINDSSFNSYYLVLNMNITDTGYDNVSLEYATFDVTTNGVSYPLLYCCVFIVQGFLPNGTFVTAGNPCYATMYNKCLGLYDLDNTAIIHSSATISGAMNVKLPTYNVSFQPSINCAFLCYSQDLYASNINVQWIRK
jgi:hypothetical protein